MNLLREFLGRLLGMRSFVLEFWTWTFVLAFKNSAKGKKKSVFDLSVLFVVFEMPHRPAGAGRKVALWLGLCEPTVDQITSAGKPPQQVKDIVGTS